MNSIESPVNVRRVKPLKSSLSDSSISCWMAEGSPITSILYGSPERAAGGSRSVGGSGCTQLTVMTAVVLLTGPQVFETLTQKFFVLTSTGVWNVLFVAP